MTHTLANGMRICTVDCPEGKQDIEFWPALNKLVITTDKRMTFDLEAGNWTLLGRFDEITEETWRDLFGVPSGEPPYVPYYRPYGMSEEEYIHESRIAEHKLAQWEEENSPINFARSLIPGNPVVLIEKK